MQLQTRRSLGSTRLETAHKYTMVNCAVTDLSCHRQGWRALVLALDMQSLLRSCNGALVGRLGKHWESIQRSHDLNVYTADCREVKVNEGLIDAFRAILGFPCVEPQRLHGRPCQSVACSGCGKSRASKMPESLKVSGFQALLPCELTWIPQTLAFSSIKRKVDPIWMMTILRKTMAL